MSPLLAAPALGLWLFAFARYVWAARPRRDRLRIGFLDLPLGLALTFHLELPPVAARERLRSALLRSGVFSVVPEEGGRVAFRQGSRASPWFGELWRPTQPQVFVGSYVTERSEPSGSRLLIRFSTVPVVGWALLAATTGFAYLLVLFIDHQRGIWFWLAALALLLAVRSFYQAEARRIGWHLLALLGV